MAPRQQVFDSRPAGGIEPHGHAQQPDRAAQVPAGHPQALSIQAFPGGYSAVCDRHGLAYGFSADPVDLLGFACEACVADVESRRARTRYLALVALAQQAGLRHA